MIMIDQQESIVRWVWCGMTLGEVGILLFGLFSAVWPRRSIALYQWIMERFNWRVSPIDERREVRTTRVLGVLLVCLSLMGLWLLFARRV